jgi:hypothetical protein
MQLQQQNTIWSSRLTTTKGRELSKITQVKNYFFLSWATDKNKVTDLLDFIVNNVIPSTFGDI